MSEAAEKREITPEETPTRAPRRIYVGSEGQPNRIVERTAVASMHAAAPQTEEDTIGTARWDTLEEQSPNIREMHRGTGELRSGADVSLDPNKAYHGEMVNRIIDGKSRRELKMEKKNEGKRKLPPIKHWPAWALKYRDLLVGPLSTFKKIVELAANGMDTEANELLTFFLDGLRKCWRAGLIDDTYFLWIPEARQARFRSRIHEALMESGRVPVRERNVWEAQLDRIIMQL